MSAEDPNSDPLGQSGSRRDFLKRSTAASIISPAIFAGLIRAAAGEDSTTTSGDPWETTAEYTDYTSEYTTDYTTDYTSEYTSEYTTDYTNVDKDITKQTYQVTLWGTKTNNTWAHTTDKSKATPDTSHPSISAPDPVINPDHKTLNVGGNTVSDPVEERDHVHDGTEPEIEVKKPIAWGTWKKDSGNGCWYREGTIIVEWKYD